MHLTALAERGVGQASIVARFLAGLYNGTAFPFDLTELRGLDEDLFEHCLAVLRRDNTPKAEIHKYFPDGEKRFQRTLTDWNLISRPAPAPVAGQYCDVSFSTYGMAPGNRHITLHVRLVGARIDQVPIEMCFSAADSLHFVDAIRDTHQVAWEGGRPLDANDHEKKPSWCA